MIQKELTIQKEVTLALIKKGLNGAYLGLI